MLQLSITAALLPILISQVVSAISGAQALQSPFGSGFASGIVGYTTPGAESIATGALEHVEKWAGAPSAEPAYVEKNGIICEH